MFKKFTYFLTFTTILMIGLFSASPAKANSSFIGTFVDVSYEEVQLDKGLTEKRLSGITLKNAQGRTVTLNIDKYAKLYVDTTTVAIEAFKLGMEIEADVNFRRVKTLHGKTGTAPGVIELGDKALTGLVNQIDKNGQYISIKLANGQSKTYYLNAETEIYKGTTLVDLSVLYEGDRVKLSFSKYDTNLINSIEINVQGIKVEALYKGNIQRINPISKKIILKNQSIFLDWKWQTINPYSNSTYSYSTKVPIYVGDQPIKPDRLRYYQNHDVYLATVSQFGEEVVEKMVIKKSNERTYFKPMTSVNTATKIIGLQSSGKFRYHDGTILIRNGRLVDPTSLQSSGTAFVVTDGAQSSEYANVVHIQNDGFQSPNLTDHTIYFGRIQSTSTYGLKLNNAQRLDKNYWRYAATPSLTFSNDSVVVEDFNQSVLDVIARDEMDDHLNKFAYFYVANGNIVAAHILEANTPSANLVSVGRLDSVYTGNPDILRVRNVSQWINGAWHEAGNISSMNIEQATIIKDGKVILAKDLRINDRLYIVHESQVKGRIILVN